MKIAICSDLHLEFSDLDLSNDEAADVLILGGDIFIAKELVRLVDPEEASRLVPTSERSRAEKYYNFIEKCSQRFPNVLLIAGNHEHYYGDFADTLALMKGAFSDLNNVYVLDKESIVIGDITFFGGTLWTDMNKEDPVTMYMIKNAMNDFNCIRNTLIGPHTKFQPEDAVTDHNDFLEKLKTLLAMKPTEKIVVCGHHSPSKLSTHPKYKDEVLMNGGYSSDLSNFILDNSNIKLWTHGHTHDPFDYMFGSTRIVCNPRGYHGYEQQAEEFQLKYLEV